ncbi:hypothetical protein RHMOL_Rhmol05G0071800 [Rhododendron molle]|uniref:Uncharacterized protein n=1 Tax=Rhododendron molle TaxID=49168 RepID=A0ACC0NMJ8_RHOML|nr:hypothetical protein RHMOL_Rhmol05G0071800 [Rhododendron molle]
MGSSSSSLLLLTFLALSFSGTQTVLCHAFSIQEATIQDLQTAFRKNQLTSRQLVEFYVGEIQRLNPILRGVLEVNPDALRQADAADRERRDEEAPRSFLYGLHGIPVLLKDNIATKDRLNTTAGSFALLGSVVPRDAGVVMKLRKAGVIILGKASLSEWMGFRSLTAPEESMCSIGESLWFKQWIGDIGCSKHGSSFAGNRNRWIHPLSGQFEFSSRNQTNSRRKGAILVDSLQIANIEEILNYTASGEGVAALAEFKLSSNAYLRDLVASPVRSLADVIAFNDKNPVLEMMKEFGLDIFLLAEATNGIGDTEKAALLNLASLTRDGFVKVMKENKLDAMVTPVADSDPVLAIGGFPGISVPAGFDVNGVPFGIAFGGLKGSEPKLIEIAYGFEQATKFRKPPSFKP